jgi:heme/copper-type cytochrome/quinol oxidase subunit 4
MSTHSEQLDAGARRADTGSSAVTVGIAIFAVIQLALALFMAAAPHAFYKAIGPFGAFNAHYIRDVASFYGAIGIGLALSVSRPGWRVPVLAVTTIQYALHSVNHLFSINGAHPQWAGYFDCLLLAVATILLASLWVTAALNASASALDASTAALAQARRASATRP